ncbi:MAG: hypothetical protein IJT64_05665 [Kiritimatiellae bacterium]|nr:hypothetical protein [Kiritimatiellia bacterium]
MSRHLPSLILATATAITALATETENVDFRVLRTKGAVSIDAEYSDWDLSGSIFCCPDVETFRASYSVWISAMFDADNLYLLFRWNDASPMNNPGLAGSDYPWQGDCMQVRLATSPQSATAFAGLQHNTDVSKRPIRFAHFEFWRDREGKAAAGATLSVAAQPKGEDVMGKGVKEAFKEVPGGYVQEVSVPWSLICEGSYRPKTGDRMLLTFEANYRTSGDQRLSTKDFFRKGIQPDRSMTFMRFDVWGEALFVDKGGVPSPIRLADGREMPVAMKNGTPTADWSSLKGVREKPGFKPIKFRLDEAGEVSIVVRDASGEVVAWPLSAQPLPAGEHEILWNGLSACYDTHVGDPVQPGRYTWEGLFHKPLHLEMRGWAHGAGPNPYDVAGGGWGGDHGDPCAVACDAERIYIGWERAEAGQSVIAADYAGNRIWGHKRGGFGTAHALAPDREGHLYVYDAGQGNIVYRLDASKGTYDNFPSTKSAELPLDQFGLGQAKRMRFADGRLEFIFEKEMVSVAVTNQKDVKRRPTKPEDLAAAAIAPDGTRYVATGAPKHQIAVVGKDGRQIRRIGREGGRRLSGKWDKDGLFNVADMTIDDKGFLWVAEKDSFPRRVSKWNAATGAFEAEFFGATFYGALGGAICPSDPHVMVGQGCEWRLDGKSPRAECVGYVARDAGWGCSRFGRGPKGEIYCAIAGWWSADSSRIRIYQRMAPGEWKFRASIVNSGKGIKTWADQNDDGAEQPGEVLEFTDINIGSWITGWYMTMNQAMTWFSGKYAIPVTGWTKCGAPIYDLAKAVKMSDEAAKHTGGMGATAGVVSEDGRFAIYNAQYNTRHSYSPCYDINTGKCLFRFPNCYVGVHGGHSAPTARRGLIRAAYDFIGTAKFPGALGNVFVIGTDKGEWHILNDRGFYVAGLFEPDPMRVKWPATFDVGTRLDNTPPGQGSEDFGGSMIRADDGELYIMFGKTAFIEAKVDGLKSAKEIKGGVIEITQADVATAKDFADRLRRGKLTAGTCDFEPDEEEPEEVFTASVKCEGGRLVFKYDVTDSTPWVNGASDFRNMYAMGDTVDFQLADAKGDMRLSVGQAGETAIVATLYKQKSNGEKAPHTFYSGVYRDGVTWDLVKEIPVKADLTRREGGYTIEFSIDEKELDLSAPLKGRKAKGDFGVTFGDAAGKDTVLRVFKFNKATGIVSDEVEELKLQPANWGEISF